MYIVLDRALYRARNVRGIFGSEDGGGLDWEVEVEGFHPSDIVKGVTRERDALQATVTDAPEALLERHFQDTCASRSAGAKQEI